MLMVMLLKPDLRNDDSRVVNAEGGVVLWHSWEFSQNRLIIAQIGQSGTPTIPSGQWMDTLKLTPFALSTSRYQLNQKHQVEKDTLPGSWALSGLY